MALVQLVTLIFLTQALQAQTNTFPSTGSAGIGTITPDHSSLLELKSTTKGFLPPRMTKKQRDAIANPATGLLIYQKNNKPGFYFYDGNQWTAVSAAASSGSNWLKNGTSLYYNSGNVGIGTSTPTARLQVIDSSVVFSAAGDVPETAGDVPISGAGRRMMWYPDKAAFRVGYANGNEWDEPYIGNYSFASGGHNTASGVYSVALGGFNTASGPYSVAIGATLHATNYYDVALGYYGYATGYNAIALSNYSATASGEYSTAMGSLVTTNGMRGSFIIGDYGSGRNNNVYYNDNPDQMQMVFAGGYRLYTGTSASGVLMNGGDNSWSSISDSTKKEKKLLVNGEDVLNKIAKFKLYTWNYKGQDSKKFRHYGPMAQDFHNAFGKDAIGTIGNDTLINQQDFLGVSFIAIQALEKRTEVIQSQQNEIDSLNTKLNDLENKLNRIENAMSQCCKSFSTNMQSTGNQSGILNNDFSSASLQQNIPNPYNQSTTIPYTLPKTFSSARIIITSISGKTIQQVPLSHTQAGSINIQSGSWTAGVYNYSLVIDGKLIDTKKMVIAK